MIFWGQNIFKLTPQGNRPTLLKICNYFILLFYYNKHGHEINIWWTNLISSLKLYVVNEIHLYYKINTIFEELKFVELKFEELKYININWFTRHWRYSEASHRGGLAPQTLVYPSPPSPTLMTQY